MYKTLTNIDKRHKKQQIPTGFTELMYIILIRHVSLQKTKIMKNEVMLSKLERRLSRRQLAGLTFPDVCRQIGVNPERMERCLQASLGISGDKLLKCYEFDVPILLL